MDSINNLVALQSMVKQAGVGTSTSQIIARRLSLGGVRSAANTFANKLHSSCKSLFCTGR